MGKILRLRYQSKSKHRKTLFFLIKFINDS
nr:MAG TPA: hypothetical protein [Caudoviricetes sp.]